MKRIALFCLITTVMIWTTACGSSTPTATSVPATAAPTTASASGTEVNITLEDNTIKSSQTDFKVGVPYTFIIVNNGHHAHNFNIATPVSLAGSLDAALSSALLVVTRDQLQVGETVTVNYTFPDSAADQKLEFSCLIPMHYQDGMFLAITVTK
jgi:uncharacterized cupredoxin-like copper-binding protein